jgi:hypothetical protein
MMPVWLRDIAWALAGGLLAPVTAIALFATGLVDLSTAGERAVGVLAALGAGATLAWRRQLRGPAEGGS